MVTENPAKTLDGTAGGSVGVNPSIPIVQIAIAERTSGVITVLAKSNGSDVFEALQPALTIDLSVERTAVIENYSLEALSFTPSVGGDDFVVTVSQWNNK